jgi:hypothetical protein
LNSRNMSSAADTVGQSARRSERRDAAELR